MKLKYGVVSKFISCCLLVTLIFMSGINVISTSAAETSKTKSVTSTVETTKAESTFASMDLTTGKETFYNLYKNGTKIDLSEDENSRNSNETEKIDEPYFPQLTSQSNSQQSRTVFGDDNRIPVATPSMFPYSAVCTLVNHWPDGTITEGGTAWMFWEDVAITAGHCVYNADYGGWATKIEVRPAAYGYNSPYGLSEAVAIYSSTKWVEDSNWEYDYGVIKLSTDIGKSTGWFGISWTIFSLKGKDVTITGYPAEYTRKMHTMSGKITKSTTRKVYYNEIDTTGGQSGSPVYDDDIYVVAIHAYGNSSYGNSATRITYSLFDYFDSFRE